MSQLTKMIFQDPELLKVKLNDFLQTPQKLYIYTRAAQKFYKGERLKFLPTWSWWGFFGCGWFFIYRKLYLEGFVLVFFSLLFGVTSFFESLENSSFYASILLCFYSALRAKYAVIKRFEQLIDTDANLLERGGVANWAIFVGIFVTILSLILYFVAAAIFGLLDFIDENFYFEFKEYLPNEPSIEVLMNFIKMC